MAIYSSINRPLSDAAKARILNVGLLLGIVALGAYFRLVNLPSNPGWYYDEGVFINAADNLLHGHWQSFNMTGSPMMLQRPPLFVYLLTGVFSLFGVSINSARGLCAVFSLLELFLVYRIGRRAGDEKIALLAAALFAILPQFVEFNRMAYSYNSTALFGLLGVDAGLNWLENRRPLGLLVACLAVGLAASSDYTGLVFVVVIGLVVVLNHPRRLLLSLLAIALPFILMVLPFIISSPRIFLEDMGFVYGYRVGMPLINQVINLIINYGELIRSEAWCILGLAGLFLLSHTRTRWLCLGATLLSMVMIVRTVVPVGRGLHYLIPVFPYLALGLASFMLKAFSLAYRVLYEGFTHVNSRLQWLGRLGILGFVFWLIFGPLLWMVFANISQSVQGYYFLFTESNDMALVSQGDAEKVIAYLKLNAAKDSTILASADLAWALPTTHKAEVNCALSDEINQGSDHPAFNFGRQLYGCDLNSTDFIVLTPHSVIYAPVLDARMTLLLNKIYAWNLAYQSGSLTVYRNPQK